MFDFNEMKEFWYNNDFLIMLIICIILLVIFGLYNKLTNNKGTWNDKVIFTSDYISSPIQQQNHIKKKTDSLGEIECRRVLSKIFQKPFDKIRPHFLNNVVTGGSHNLEIDCYNHELRLGVEYQGKQHYEFVPYFHKNKEAFYNQKYRDELKRHLCKDNNITLIEVPYNIKIVDIENYILKKLQAYDIRRN